MTAARPDHLCLTSTRPTYPAGSQSPSPPPGHCPGRGTWLRRTRSASAPVCGQQHEGDGRATQREAGPRETGGIAAQVGEILANSPPRCFRFPSAFIPSASATALSRAGFADRSPLRPRQGAGPRVIRATKTSCSERASPSWQGRPPYFHATAAELGPARWITSNFLNPASVHQPLKSAPE